MTGKRYLATFFRGRRLYIPVLLLLLAATVLGTYYLAMTQYEATARIWVDKPALANVLNANAPPDYLYLVSPAQQTADKLTELIQTDSFVTSVLSDTGAAGQLTGGAEQDRVIKETRGKLGVTALGPNTVKITYAGNDPVLCQQIVQGTIDQFRNRDLTARVEQNAIEREFYQKQLEIYEGQVDAAAKRVDDFQRDHPYPDPSSPQYLELQSLQREVESARSLLNTTRTKIEQANAADSLAGTSRQVEFQVLDAPTVPERPAATTTRLAAYLALGVLLSLGIVLAAVAFATWQDTTVRSEEDLQRLTNVPLLEAIPHLPFQGVRGGERQSPAGVSRARKMSAGSRDEPATVYPSSMTE
jgi:uncharacterized protein involved in exopolysaccharide biosynthesis